ncbi:MAG: hypothetical protein KDE47_28430 [Caldilineaceae bacterium]|nr:hypothetical protein [Caldilineaceae bacterium]
MVSEHVAFGLTKHPAHGYRHLLGRFAHHVNAVTYWDLYDDTFDAPTMAERILCMMVDARCIHFNLDGMVTDETTLADLYERGSVGAGEGNWTNWEFYIIVSNEILFNKTVFYLGGKIVLDDIVT